MEYSLENNSYVFKVYYNVNIYCSLVILQYLVIGD